MLRSSIEAIAEEFSWMVRQKMIFVIIIMIPLLVNFLIGFVLYNNTIKHIPMAVVDQDNSVLSRTIVQQFRENDTFTIRYDLNNSDELKKLLDDSKVRVGMVIPEGFSKDITELKAPTVLMLYDGSHMSIASTAKTKATEILITLKTGILIKLIQGKLSLPADVAKKMAMDISFSSRTLYNPAKSFKNFLSPGLGTAIVQTGLALMGAVAIRNHEIRRRKRDRLGYLVGKILFYSVLGTLSLLLTIIVQTQIFGVPLRGSLEEILLLSLAFSAAVVAFSLMVSAWVRKEMMASVICAIAFIPNSIMVGYTWPVISMPKIYQTIAPYIPFYHYADNIRDLCLKGSTVKPVILEVEWLLQFALASAVIALIGLFRLRSAELQEEDVRFIDKLKMEIRRVQTAQEGE